MAREEIGREESEDGEGREGRQGQPLQGLTPLILRGGFKGSLWRGRASPKAA